MKEFSELFEDKTIYNLETELSIELSITWK